MLEETTKDTNEDKNLDDADDPGRPFIVKGG